LSEKKQFKVCTALGEPSDKPKMRARPKYLVAVLDGGEVRVEAALFAIVSPKNSWAVVVTQKVIEVTSEVDQAVDRALGRCKPLFAAVARHVRLDSSPWCLRFADQLRPLDSFWLKPNPQSALAQNHPFVLDAVVFSTTHFSLGPHPTGRPFPFDVAELREVANVVAEFQHADRRLVVSQESQQEPIAVPTMDNQADDSDDDAV